MTPEESLQIKMNRKGFGLKEAIKGDLHVYYHSGILQEIKEAGYAKTYGDVTVHLAKEFGFCYGVDRAVELAYETRRQFPDKRIFLTTEIIHNPLVNTNLRQLGVRFLSGPYQDGSLDDVQPEDVVIVPAFGTTIPLLRQLVDKKCELVDTICASVIVVWKRVEKYAREGFTVLVHGKYFHEETQATTSRVSVFPKGRYLIVFDEHEAQYVCDYITKGGSRAEFMKKFEKCLSHDFDPDTDLAKIGLANQTTMLSTESMQIASMIKQALITRYGEAVLKEHFMSFDTICNATQERQDAILALKEKKPDFIIVIGGYNSSNTNHLCEISEGIASTYHINSVSCVVSPEIIRHKRFGQKEEIETSGWMKPGPLSFGITAGASTPNQEIGETIERILSFR